MPEDLFPSSRSNAPSLRYLLLRQGQVLLTGNRLTEAVAAMEQALREPGVVPQDKQILSELARAYSAANQPETAFRTLVQSAAAWPEECSDLLKRAEEEVTSLSVTTLLPWLEVEWPWLRSKRFEQADSPQRLLAAKAYAAARAYDRAVQLLQYECAENRQKQHAPTQSADRLYDIATTCNEEDRLEVAESVLRVLTSIAPDRSNGWWLLSEVLRRRSYAENTPKLSEEAVRAWDRGLSTETEPSAWALGIRAAINEQLAKLEGVDRWSLGWEGLCLAQRAVKRLDSSDSYHLGALARWYRYLNLPVNEDLATGKAYEIAARPEDKRYAMEERIVTAVNVGHFEEVKQLIAERREQGVSGWLDLIEAFLLLRSGEPEKALQLALTGIVEFQQVWSYQLVADCYRVLNRIPDAIREYEGIRERCPPGDWEDAVEFAYACHWLAICGQPTAALAEQALRDYEANYALPEEPALLMMKALFAVTLATDENAGREALSCCIGVANLREIEDLIGYLRSAAELHHDPAQRDRILRALTDPEFGVEALARKRTDFLTASPPSAESELKSMLERRGKSDANGWLWIGVQAGLGRLAADQGNHAGAIERYRALATQASSRFPEALAALQTAAEHRLRDADSLLRQYRSEEATSIYQDIFADGLLSAATRYDASIGLGLLALTRGAIEEANHLLNQSAMFGPETHGNSKVIGRLRQLLPDEQAFWTALKFLDAARWATMSDADRTDLLVWFSDRYKMWAQEPSADLPGITLELGRALIPEFAYTDWREWDLFIKHIPELRSRIEAVWGVTLPGIKVRENQYLTTNGYAILIDNIPLPFERGEVQVTGRFSSAPPASLLEAGIDSKTLVNGYAPLTGNAGAWIDETDSDRLGALGLPAGSLPIEYIVAHLEWAVLCNLEMFMWFDEAEALLSVSAEDADLKKLIQNVLPSSTNRFYFARVLQSLLRHKVPILRMREILTAMQGIFLDERTVATAVRKARTALRASLPGNGPQWDVWLVPSEVEELAGDLSRTPANAAKADEEILDALRTMLRSKPRANGTSGIALVVTGLDSAEALRNLLRPEPEFRYVVVLSKEESNEQFRNVELSSLTTA